MIGRKPLQCTNDREYLYVGLEITPHHVLHDASLRARPAYYYHHFEMAKSAVLIWLCFASFPFSCTVHPWPLLAFFFSLRLQNSLFDCKETQLVHKRPTTHGLALNIPPRTNNGYHAEIQCDCVLHFALLASTGRGIMPLLLLDMCEMVSNYSSSSGMKSQQNVQTTG